MKGFGAGHGWAENCKTESDLYGSGPKNSKTFSDFEHKSRQNYFFWTCVRCAFFGLFFLDPRAAGDPYIFLPRASENPSRLRDASVAYPPPVVREPTPSAHPPGRCAARVEPLAVGAENKAPYRRRPEVNGWHSQPRKRAHVRSAVRTVPCGGRAIGNSLDGAWPPLICGPSRDVPAVREHGQGVPPVLPHAVTGLLGVRTDRGFLDLHCCVGGPAQKRL